MRETRLHVLIDCLHRPELTAKIQPQQLNHRLQIMKQVMHSFNPYKPSILFVGYANSADPDQTPQSAASDQGLHCLLTECSIKIRIKNEKYNLTTL